MKMYLYIIQAKDRRGPVKIGVSRDAKARLINLQSAHYRELEIRTTIDCGHFNARVIESKVHNWLKDTRIRGEWFRWSHRMLRLIDNPHINRVLGMINE
jgi:hypothetical protein